jgi:hypothetical protein
MDPDELRQRARHFRQLASLIPDDQAHVAAFKLARECEVRADALDWDEALDSRCGTAEQSPTHRAGLEKR